MDDDKTDSELERRVLPDIPSVDIPTVDASDTVENPEEELVPEPGSRTNAGRSTVDAEARRQFAGAAALVNIVLLAGGVGALLLLFEGVSAASIGFLLIAVLSGAGGAALYRRVRRD